ncbi:MAG TPA: class I SAM-dependent methyltransferase, partial [Chloroflexi bacterium]|nr:class I SAM-dependent methyltransferase [Chloroflexota bacterium]
MNPNADPLLKPEAAFDHAAASYDAAFTDTHLGRLLREAVWARLAQQFQPGMHILELNCGTGEDAIWLARRGLRVTATDNSPGMLAVARGKAGRAGVDDRIEFRRLDLGEIGEWRFEVEGERREREDGPAGFDGVLSNFGGLN